MRVSISIFNLISADMGSGVFEQSENYVQTKFSGKVERMYLHTASTYLLQQKSLIVEGPITKYMEIGNDFM